MTYRDDLDALTARHATLQAELGRKQRELAELTEMLEEAGRVNQAERYFERRPELRRARHPLLVGALVTTVAFGAALGYGAVAGTGAAAAAAEVTACAMPRSAASLPLRSPEQVQRLKAEIEALQVLGLIPVVAPEGRRVALAKADRREPAWILGSSVPARGSLWSGSPSREDQR
jgi:hypothetical protein